MSSQNLNNKSIMKHGKTTLYAHRQESEAQKNVILILYVQLFLKKEHFKTINLSACVFQLLKMNSEKLSGL